MGKVWKLFDLEKGFNMDDNEGLLEWGIEGGILLIMLLRIYRYK